VHPGRAGKPSAAPKADQAAGSKPANTANTAKTSKPGKAAASAPILIMLHGNGEDMHIFDQRKQQLEEHYTIITMDSRGQGKSSAGSQPLSYQLLAQDLFMLTNKLQIGRFLLLGFSDGANTALEFALQHQERLSALILVGANLDPQGLSTGARAWIQLHVLGYSLAKPFWPQAKDRCQLMRLMLEHPHIQPQHLAKINVPTLVITGQRDVIRDEHSQLITSSLPQARRVNIAGAGHFVMRDAPAAFDAAVYEFLMEE